MGFYETQEANYEYQKSMRESYKEGYEQGKKDATSKWIPVSERLPKTNGWRMTFNVTYEQGGKYHVTSMEWENTTVRGKSVSRWIWKDKLSPWHVVAWMPLPEAWKGEDNGKTG